MAPKLNSAGLQYPLNTTFISVVMVMMLLLYPVMGVKNPYPYAKPRKAAKGRSSVSAKDDYNSMCAGNEAAWSYAGRSHQISITQFGGKGDGATLNTLAFQKAIAHIQAYNLKKKAGGGAQLNIPAGIWVTGSFNLTSHMTLFLDQGAVIRGSQDPNQWPVISPLPSYGRGRELPGGRRMSLIHGEHLDDVIITGNNGTVDGQGAMWWDMWRNRKLDYTRGSLVELVSSANIAITNLTFKDSPFWMIHPVYCNNVFIKSLTIIAPLDSPNTDGIDPDSSSNVCIRDCYINTGDDLVAIKSGWDEYGISYGRSCTNITIRGITGYTRSSSGIAIGSEMSGGVSNVRVSEVHLQNAGTGIRVKASIGRGGYVRDISVSNVTIDVARIGIQLVVMDGEHPDNNYNPNAWPIIERVFIDNLVGYNVTSAGKFNGMPNSIFRDVHLTNIHINVVNNNPNALAWDCSFVQGYSNSVFPKPCPSLDNATMH